jgi:hypothetical protein
MVTGETITDGCGSRAAVTLVAGAVREVEKEARA